ncbi:MAG: hypothetical protein CFE21_11650 [Bacteroidetes bacterium B1(2017)]|nr:MAG: hypothetical protein CFE21_11650 [Bacteroidetes bacterium B1(2017)]
MTDPIAAGAKQAKPKRMVVGVLSIVFGIINLFVIGYLDFDVLSPLILPKDYCYYHLHDIPWWVELFYLSGSSNGHPDGSIFHYFLVFILSLSLGFIASRALINKFSNK